VKFAGAAFGPMALRRIARERFEPGEQFVGWAMARMDPPVWTQALLALLSGLPGAGWALAAQVSPATLLILSDRRLWLVSPRAAAALSGPDLVRSERSLDDLRIELEGPAAKAENLELFRDYPFRMKLGGPRVREVRFMVGKRDAARRLPEAFRLLARSRAEPGGYAGGGA
jgi:hypothetical protein